LIEWVILSTGCFSCPTKHFLTVSFDYTSVAVDFEEASRKEALDLLKRCIGTEAEFRPQQWEAIDDLVNRRERLLLVQRTGWGKSTVYFIATRLLRDRGEGPTLIVSPLLSLMRNQIQDAEDQLGLTAITINSNNTDEWEAAEQAVIEGTCDLLLISPERLANPEFRQEVLQEMERGFGMLVIDEAHCISDWGHDFRPDYRRIRRILQRLPDNIPVAATTATANDRVVDDVTDQINGLNPLRGDLVRESLRIQTNKIGSRSERLAWLAENVEETPVSGIVYCLTTSEVEAVADWLNEQGLDVKPYHGGMEGDQRQDLESQLMDNGVDALVATNALGMGFNKPDLGWVIHFQRPPNLIRYYQEIGRAGRELDESYAILLSGDEDDDIAEYFIEEAFPEPHQFNRILDTIAESGEPLSKRQIVKRIDIAWGTASDCLKILRVEGALSREDNGYIRTANPWSYDHERIEAVTEQRWEELERIQEFVDTDECLTRFIDDELDGNLEAQCGRCANCTGPFLPEDVQNDDLVRRAVEHYRSASRQQIDPRYYIHQEDGSRNRISEDKRLQTGRVLSIYDDPGWGKKVREGKYETGRFDEELVTAAVDLIESWNSSPEPTWVTSVPSTSNEGLVSDFARRLAEKLGLRYLDTLEKVRKTEPQKEMKNSYQKCYNVRDAFEANANVKEEPVLLVDDIVGSRWTLTETGITLREAGSGPVFPFALAERRGW
jgi:ATP-dependent DNA helicase RecQ